MNRPNLLKKSEGFTLVELLVVIAIVAILSVTAYVALSGQTGKANDSRRQSDLASIQTALTIYFSDYSKFPDTLDSLVEDGQMPNLPLDPTTDTNYVYGVSDNKKQYQLGATLEGDDGSYSAYIIGNVTQGKPSLLEGVVPPDGDGCGSEEEPVNGSVNCVPMNIWE